MSDLVLYHAPQTRSTGVLTLLAELAAPHTLKLINFKASQQLGAEFLAINPMGKVPTVVHNGAVITEQVAIYLYLADLFPAAGLAPALTSPLRGPYLRWMAFYGSAFEPAVVDRAQKREPGPRGMSPYGDFDGMLNALIGQLSQGDYFLGSQFSALDVLWGKALTWMVGFKLVPEHPVLVAYVERFNARPLVAKVKAEDAVLAAQMVG